MGVEKDRKVETLLVEESMFKSALDRARERQKSKIGLREMVVRHGPALRLIVTQPGEIERMARDYRDGLQKQGLPAADEMSDDLEAILVEIRRRIEEGTLRTSRKASAATLGDATGPEEGAADRATEREGGADSEETRYESVQRHRQDDDLKEAEPNEGRALEDQDSASGGSPLDVENEGNAPATPADRSNTEPTPPHGAEGEEDDAQ